MSNALMTTQTQENYSLIMQQATTISKSSLIPNEYKGKPENCLIALQIANRTGADTLMVMQNLNIIHGRPSWSSQYIISAVNSCGRFGPLRFKFNGEGDNRSCVAYAADKETGEILEGPPSSIKMAKAEGWYSKTGSKWVTMPENMLMYRAAAFFGRLYAPDILMGMYAEDEVLDMVDVTPKEKPKGETSMERLESVLSEPVAEVVEAEVAEVIEPVVIEEVPLSLNNGEYDWDTWFKKATASLYKLAAPNATQADIRSWMQANEKSIAMGQAMETGSLAQKSCQAVRDEAARLFKEKKKK